MTPEEVFDRMNDPLVQRVQRAIAETLGFEEGTGSAAIAAIEAIRTAPDHQHVYKAVPDDPNYPDGLLHGQCDCGHVP